MRNLVKVVLMAIAITCLISCQHTRAPHRYEDRQYVFTPDQPADTVMSRLIHPYRDSLHSIMGKTLAYSAAPLSDAMARTTAVLTPSQQALFNFAADASLQQVRLYCKQQQLPAPDFAVFNQGGLRSSLPQGAVTLGNIYELMPFENTFIVLKLDGKVMAQLLDYLAKRGGDAVADLTLTTTQPGQARIQGTPFDPTRSYYVLTHDYLASGGDNFTFFKEAGVSHPTDLKMRDALIDYLRNLTDAGDTLKPVYEQRITR